ncbi:MAG: hypothetical protein WA517_06440 [Candidatus Acidiferrum sp.]
MARTFLQSRVLRRTLWPLAGCLFFSTVYPSAIRSQSANTSSAQSGGPNSDEAGKAAARKKKFEEDKKRLENSEGQHTPAPDDPQQTLLLSPILVNMLVHDTQRFSLFDVDGHNLTAKAAWTLSNSYVADLTTDGVPTITAKSTGTVTVRARVGALSSEASVTVHPGDRLPVGTIRWQAPAVPGHRTTQIIQAVPH